MEERNKQSVLTRVWHDFKDNFWRLLGISLLYEVGFSIWVLGVAVALLFCLFLLMSSCGLESYVQDTSWMGKVPNQMWGYLAYFIAYPVTYGFLVYLLHVVRKERTKVSMLFSAFSNFLRIAGTLYLGCLHIFLWSLLFFIPGLVRFLHYAMVPFILHDNPELKPKEVLARSKQMMDGHKFELAMEQFALQFPTIFIVILLGVFCVSVAMFSKIAPWIGVFLFVFIIYFLIMIANHLLLAEFYVMLKEKEQEEASLLAAADSAEEEVRETDVEAVAEALPQEEMPDEEKTEVQEEVTEVPPADDSSDVQSEGHYNKSEG